MFHHAQEQEYVSALMCCVQTIISCLRCSIELSMERPVFASSNPDCVFLHNINNKTTKWCYSQLSISGTLIPQNAIPFKRKYRRTSMARTLMARLPRLFQTRS